MRIAILDVYNPLPINSGGDWYRYQIAQDLSLSNEVTVYYLIEKKFDKGHVPKNCGFKIERMPGGQPWSKDSMVLQILRPELFVNLKVFSTIQADLVIYSVYCYPLAKMISKMNGDAEMLLFMHNVEWQYLKGHLGVLHVPVRWIEDRIIARSKGVITLSENDRDYVRKRNLKGRVYCLPPIVDNNIFNPDGDRHHFGEGKKTVLFYGSLDRKQNIDAIDFIIDELLPEIEKKGMFRLCIFGSGTPPEKLSKNLNRITFLGPVDDPGRMIRGADITIVPLRNSGGIKIRILESLACQVPTVVSPDAAKGLPDGLLDYVSVASSAKEFVEKMESVFESEASRLSGDRFREIMGIQSASNIVKDYGSKEPMGLMPVT